MKIRLLYASAAFGLFFACSRKEGPGDARVGQSGDPKSVPENIALYPVKPVLFAQFEATAQGLGLKAFLGSGDPTRASDLGRDLVIVALGAQGDTIHAVSISNPRQIHTTGARKPESAVLDTAFFVVTLPHPDRIRSLEVLVKAGPDSGMKKTFAVDPGKLPRIEAADAIRKPDR